MDVKVNPNKLILIGENSFVRLSTDGGKTASTRCSHWRVLWTPAGQRCERFYAAVAIDFLSFALCHAVAWRNTGLPAAGLSL